MNLARFRDLCLAQPGTTEQVQWVDNAVFKIGGRMFSLANIEPGTRYVCSFKCDPETFAELCERQGVVPAPYLARAQWVAVEEWDALDDPEYSDLIRRAYEIVAAKLPRRARLDTKGTTRKHETPRKHETDHSASRTKDTKSTKGSTRRHETPRNHETDHSASRTKDTKNTKSSTRKHEATRKHGNTKTNSTRGQVMPQRPAGSPKPAARSRR